MATISERIKNGLTLRNMKQADLVEKTGIGKSSISTYISGSYEPKQKNIYKIAKALDVNEAWLMGLDVPMERVESTYNFDISSEEKILLNNFKKLNDLGKNEANKRVSELTEISKYIKISDATELITATKDVPNFVLKDMFTTIAAHDDDLTEDEKNEADKRILETLTKMKK